MLKSLGSGTGSPCSTTVPPLIDTRRIVFKHFGHNTGAVDMGWSPIAAKVAAEQV
jgi:hypothetical protein